MPGATYETRIVAVLFADVWRFSQMMERDEAGTVERLAACRSLFRRLNEDYGGRVVDMTGDSILCAFGTSVISAVKCAVEIQRVLGRQNRERPPDARMYVRIGLNLCEVMDDGRNLLGDGINIAARLQTLAEPGGICLSGSVREQIRNRLPFTCEPLGRQQLKNIAEPVEVYRLAFDGAKDAVPAAPELTATPVLPSRPSIAVLPFVDLSGGQDRTYFSDGFTEDIITELSRFRTLVVMARSTSFAYRGVAQRLQRLRRELGVQYAVEGSMRRLGERARITAQLIDTASEKQIWGERYSCRADEIFEVQDEVVAQIVGRLERSLAHDRLRQAARSAPPNLTAYDYWLRGNELNNQWTAEADQESIVLFEKAVELDPNFARAYASLAAVHNTRTILLPGNPDDRRDRDRAFQLAKKAVGLDPMDARNHVNLAWGFMLTRRFANAQTHFDLALDLNPNDSNILIACAQASAYLGRADCAWKLATKALQLNPVHPEYYLAYCASIHFLAGRYAEAADTVDRVPHVLPEIQAWRAAACAHLARDADARAAAAAFCSDVRRAWAGRQEAGPADFVRWFLGIIPLKRVEEQSRLVGGLRQAGLPVPE